MRGKDKWGSWAVQSTSCKPLLDSTHPRKSGDAGRMKKRPIFPAEAQSLPAASAQCRLCRVRSSCSSHTVYPQYNLGKTPNDKNSKKNGWAQRPASISVLGIGNPEQPRVLVGLHCGRHGQHQPGWRATVAPAMLSVAIACSGSVKRYWRFGLIGPVGPLPLTVPNDGLSTGFDDGLSLAPAWQQQIVFGAWGGVGCAIALNTSFWQ
jgi:hypothetical protein